LAGEAWSPWERLGCSVAVFLIVSGVRQDEPKELLGADDAACGDPGTLADGLKAPDERSSSQLSQ
jgi:hypothetical protein